MALTHGKTHMISFIDRYVSLYISSINYFNACHSLLQGILGLRLGNLKDIAVSARNGSS